MKFPQLFSKTPGHKRFAYPPDVGKKHNLVTGREWRWEKVLEKWTDRRTGWFKTSRKTVAPQGDKSSSILRLIIPLIIAIAFPGFDRIALVGLALIFISFNLYLNVRSSGVDKRCSIC